MAPTPSRYALAQSLPRGRALAEAMKRVTQRDVGGLAVRQLADRRLIGRDGGPRPSLGLPNRAQEQPREVAHTGVGILRRDDALQLRDGLLGLAQPVQNVTEPDARVEQARVGRERAPVAALRLEELVSDPARLLPGGRAPALGGCH